MTRLVLWLALTLVAALAAAAIIALPGTMLIEAAGYRLEPGLGTAILIVIATIVLSILVFSLIAFFIGLPARLRRRAERNRRRAGVEALTDAMIALEAGAYQKARLLARDARSRLPANAAAQLLEARADLALGDFSAARERYRTLIADPRTALAALAGLFNQAQAQARPAAALTFARKALALDPALDWASEAVFDDLATRGAWSEALAMANTLPARTKAQKQLRKRRIGVLETALALTKEETDPDTALEHALSALKSVADFVPATLIAARIYINRGDTRRASSLLRRVWRNTGHPDLALLYAHVKPGASAVERLRRLTTLIETPDKSVDAAIVLARAAIEAYEWSLARNALAPFLAEPTQKVCMAMAEIEEGQSGDQGKARQWLARAVRATPDPAWTADGTIADDWAPVSPVTGRFDAFEWKRPIAGHIGDPLIATPPLATPAPQELALEAKP